MVKQRAWIENGKIRNTFTADDAFVAEHYAGKTVVDVPPGFGVGDNFDGSNFTKAVVPVEDLRKGQRAEAVRLLRACDWTQIPDALTGPEKAAWLAYRASLRAVAKNPTADPTVPLPDPPGSFVEA